MKGKCPLFSRMKSVSGSVNLMPNSGQKSLFAKYVENRKDIDPNGYLDIIVHGNSKIVEVQSASGYALATPRMAAKIIKNKEGFKKAKGIRLLSCNTGSKPNGFAQHLANALGKPVLAPNMTIHCYPNGTYWIEDNGIYGEFVKFIPGGIKSAK